MNSEALLEKMVEACDDKRAEDIMTFDVKETSTVTDYYIICHGNSGRQVQTIADEIKDQAKDLDIEPLVIIHVFHGPEREYYNLERLFKNGEHIDSRH